MGTTTNNQDFIINNSRDFTTSNNRDSTTNNSNNSRDFTMTNKMAKKASPPPGKRTTSKKVMEAAKKLATARVSAVMIANNHKPGATENRVLSQISAERIAYEAAEIFMNSQAPDDNLDADAIKKQLFAIAVKAIDG